MFTNKKLFSLKIGKIFKMHSEFTISLIDEVQKREILYNTKYEKRPKVEKQQCWDEIAEVLNCEIFKKYLKKHFFKVNIFRHFQKGSNTLEKCP